MPGNCGKRTRCRKPCCPGEPDIPASVVHRLIWDDVDGFVDGAEPFDDMTLVVAKITGG
jgi:hypothetical protein